MGIFWGNYNKEGKGVEKGQAEKSSIKNISDIFFRKFWYFSKVNLLYSVYLIPAYILIGAIVSITLMNFSDKIVQFLEIKNNTNENVLYVNLYMTVIIMNAIVSVFGLGPATMGFSFAMNKYAKEEHLWIVEEMKSAIRENRIAGIKIMLIDIASFFLFFIAISQYKKMGGIFVYLNFVILFLALMYILTHLYVYPLFVTRKEPIKDTVKKAFILAIGELPTSLFLLCFTLFVHVIIPIAITLLFGKTFILILMFFCALEITILQSLTGFVTGYFTNKIITKYLVNRK